MKRSDFLKTLGTGSLAVCAACGMVSCSDDDAPAPASGVDFTINIEDAAYSNLKTVGGSIIKDNLIIARTGTNTFIALSKRCPHEGVTVTYDHPNSQIVCYAHNSFFTTSGSFIKGPANKGLSKYNTSFNSPNLRVFS